MQEKTISPRDSSIIEHIRSYCEDIERAVLRFGDSYEQFEADKDYRNSCVLCILQIGELCNHLSEEFRLEHTELPWRAIIGMRNIAAHHYGSMSMERVWGTVKLDIPTLHDFCNSILNQK